MLIYVQTPREVKAIANKLRSEIDKEQRGLAKSRGEKYRKPDSWDHRIAILNGRMRGYERDKMAAGNKVYRKFLNAESVDESIYFVCTSAGEVGIDIDADHMVCDMSSMDSLIQRLGRVNRRGGKQAQVDIVYNEEKEDKKKKKPAPSQATCAILKRWGEFNGSPENLRILLSELTDTERAAAFSSTAQPPPLNDIILDEWSMTSVDRIPSRGNVQQYLHGREDYRPMIHVVWRQEIDLFAAYGGIDDRTLTDWFRMCPVRSRERLPVLLSETKKELSKMEGSAVRIDPAGNAEWIKLSELADIDDQVDCTLVLSPTSGGLDSSGMLDTKVQDTASDVTVGTEPERGRRIEGVDGPCPFADDIPSSWPERGRVRLRIEDERPAVELVLYMPAKEMPAEHAAFHQTLDEHTRRIVEATRTIASQLGLPAEVSAALMCAAWWHDKGKRAEIWQQYANNAHGCEPLAKSKNYGNPRSLRGYRHELGSMAQAIDEGVDSDLTLHLIATHHGWSRPHFKENAYEHVKSQPESWEIAVTARCRFDQLQRQYGRWTLAWLESILRCADALASTKEE